MKTESFHRLEPESGSYKDARRIADDYITASPRILPNGMIGKLQLETVCTQHKKRKEDEANETLSL